MCSYHITAFLLSDKRLASRHSFFVSRLLEYDKYDRMRIVVLQDVETLLILVGCFAELT
jgi:hypothetical protein